MASELVTAMLRVVEDCDREEGEIRLVTEIFPPFADLFKQIYAADKAFALQCMHHYTSWLEGPPNRPTEDEVRSAQELFHAGLVMFSTPALPGVESVCFVWSLACNVLRSGCLLATRIVGEAL